MILTLENIAHYLLDKGLVSLESIINGEFSVRDNSSRNSNFAVNKEYQPSYLIKQVKAKDAEKTQTMRIEATCYWLANNDAQYRILKDFLPKYYEYDYLEHILILELLPDVINLHEYYYGAGKFHLAIAKRMGALLAAYHSDGNNDLSARPSFKLFSKNKPWVFQLLQNKKDNWNHSNMKASEKQLLQLIYDNEEFLHLLRPIAKEWEVKSLIHGDVKFPNFLINQAYTNGATLDLRLIDWELADIGDPLWDVAAIFQNYLSLWVSVEIENQQSKNSKAEHFKIENIQPSIRVFWKQYSEDNKWTVEVAQTRLEKAVRFTALKLIHTCFESTPYTKHLQPYCAKILQLSLNLLKYPEDSIQELLGIQTLKYHAATV